MKETNVSYELAVALKEIGFDWDCYGETYEKALEKGLINACKLVKNGK